MKGLKLISKLSIGFIVVIMLVTIQIQSNTIDLLMEETNIYSNYNGHLEQPIEQMERIEVCSTSSFKSWMPYQAITDTTSDQYRLQQYAETESTYGLRMIDNHFVVAMTQDYGRVGDLLEIELENQTIKVIIGDIKADGHDDCESHRDGSMIEFIVDDTQLNEDIRRLGSFNTVFDGSIKSITKLGFYQ